MDRPIQMKDATANIKPSDDKASSSVKEPTTPTNAPTARTERMSSWLRFILVIYLTLIIIGSVYLLIVVWNPAISLNFQNVGKQTITTKIHGPGSNWTNTTMTQEVPVKITNVTSIQTKISPDNKTKTTTEIVRILPAQRLLHMLEKIPPFVDPWFVLTNHEIRLVIIATLFGVLGGTTHAFASLTAWISMDKLNKGWGWWYFSRPFIGGAMAVITYLILRAGFISGSPTAINDFGVAGISALVGLMTDEITQKLRDVFDTLFGIAKPKGEKGENPEPVPSTPSSE